MPTRWTPLQVLFNSEQHSLTAGVEPQKLLVRLEQYPSSTRHIRQLKSSSIGQLKPLPKGSMHVHRTDSRRLLGLQESL